MIDSSLIHCTFGYPRFRLFFPPVPLEVTDFPGFRLKWLALPGANQQCQISWKNLTFEIIMFQRGGGEVTFNLKMVHASILFYYYQFAFFSDINMSSLIVFSLKIKLCRTSFSLVNFVILLDFILNNSS